MNVLRSISLNYMKNISRQATAVLLKRQRLPSVCCAKEISLRKNSSFASTYSFTQPDLNLKEDEKITNDVLSRINTQIKEKSHGRLFAVILLGGSVFKITDEDIIALGTYFPASVGDKICLEKVLLVGSADFTLLGRPVLHKDLLRIDATVIEKTFMVPRPLYRHGRVNYRRLHWFRTPYCMIRINSIEFKYSLDDLPDVEGIQDRVIY